MGQPVTAKLGSAIANDLIPLDRGWVFRGGASTGFWREHWVIVPDQKEIWFVVDRDSALTSQDRKGDRRTDAKTSSALAPIADKNAEREIRWTAVWAADWRGIERDPALLLFQRRKK